MGYIGYFMAVLYIAVWILWTGLEDAYKLEAEVQPNTEKKDRPRGHQDYCQEQVRAYKRAEKARVRNMLAGYENR